MKYVVSVLAMALLVSGANSVAAQDKGKSKSEPPSSKVRGVLPQHYRQLGLSEEQRQNIYKIQNEYADKIDDLQKKIDDMKAERNAKYLKALTKAQRDRLEEIKKGDKEDKDK